MNIPSSCPFSGRALPPDQSPLLADENGQPADPVAAAQAFLDQFAGETGTTPDPARRENVAAAIREHGFYRQTPEELAFACRLAWRNNRRCIGRRFWESLEVVDARDTVTAEGIFEACVEHLRRSTNGGRIRPLITVFAPSGGDTPGPRIHNYQLIRYAGYQAADGTVLGDPAETGFTARLIEAGWHPPRERSAFDILPLLIETPGHPPQLFPLPADAVLEVPLTHPTLAWFADLGLKWHALPAVSNMVLDAGGVRYTAAPFSGYYMVTEIAARNFGDPHRYNLLPAIADRLDPRLRSRDPFWRDRALVEITAAVLHSFRRAGVTMVDHHTASRQFIDHFENETAAGRTVPGDWSWLVPPVSGSASPVFHRYYDPRRRLPDFVPPTGYPC